MSTDRFTLPESKVPCVTCGLTTQWADLFRRPSHGQMKEHERFTRKAINDDSALSVEDGMVHVFVNDWHVLDAAGNEIPRKMERMGDVPQDTLSVLIEEIAAITTATRPNDAIAQTVGVMRALRDRVDKDEAVTMDQAIALFQEALGVPVPNAPGQTAG
jgi:hypothetical protein